VKVEVARFEYLNIEAINVEGGIRQIIEKGSMEELVESVRQHGILQPLVVEMGEE